MQMKNHPSLLLLLGLWTHVLLPPFPNLASVTFFMRQFVFLKIIDIQMELPYILPIRKQCLIKDKVLLKVGVFGKAQVITPRQFADRFL